MEEEKEEEDRGPKVIDVDADPNTKTQKAMGEYVVGRPKLTSYAKELAGESESEDEEGEVEIVEPMELTAAQRTFTPDKPEKLYINPKPSQVGSDGRILSLPLRCSDLGIITTNPVTKKKLTCAQLKVSLRNYFVEVVQEGDEMSYLQSNCFVRER